MRHEDPTIDRIREVRHRISEEFGHDPKRLVAHYIELEKDYPGRFLDDQYIGVPVGSKKEGNS
jgi:hypothetical protein